MAAPRRRPGGGSGASGTSPAAASSTTGDAAGDTAAAPVQAAPTSAPAGLQLSGGDAAAAALGQEEDIELVDSGAIVCSALELARKQFDCQEVAVGPRVFRQAKSATERCDLPAVDSEEAAAAAATAGRGAGRTLARRVLDELLPGRGRDESCCETASVAVQRAAEEPASLSPEAPRLRTASPSAAAALLRVLASDAAGGSGAVSSEDRCGVLEGGGGDREVAFGRLMRLLAEKDARIEVLEAKLAASSSSAAPPGRPQRDGGEPQSQSPQPHWSRQPSTDEESFVATPNGSATQEQRPRRASRLRSGDLRLAGWDLHCPAAGSGAAAGPRSGVARSSSPTCWGGSNRPVRSPPPGWGGCVDKLLAELTSSDIGGITIAEDANGCSPRAGSPTRSSRRSWTSTATAPWGSDKVNPRDSKVELRTTGGSPPPSLDLSLSSPGGPSWSSLRSPCPGYGSPGDAPWSPRSLGSSALSCVIVDTSCVVPRGSRRWPPETPVSAQRSSGCLSSSSAAAGAAGAAAAGAGAANGASGGGEAGEEKDLLPSPLPPLHDSSQMSSQLSTTAATTNSRSPSPPAGRRCGPSAAVDVAAAADVATAADQSAMLLLQVAQLRAELDALSPRPQGSSVSCARLPGHLQAEGVRSSSPLVLRASGQTTTSALASWSLQHSRGRAADSARLAPAAHAASPSRGGPAGHFLAQLRNDRREGGA